MSRRNYLYVSIERLGVVLIRLISIVILSRFITPDDFGAFGLASVIVAISLLLAESGLGGSLIRLKSPSEIEYSTVFVTNFAISICFYITLLLASSWIGKFYQNSDLPDIINLLSIVIIIRSLSVANIARLTREMKYFEQAIVYVASSVISLLIAVYMAINGFGFWALVWQQITEAVLNVIGFYFLTKRGFYTKFCIKSFRSIFPFGFHLTLSSIIKNAYENACYLIIGKYFPISTVGNYSQAVKLNSFYVTLLSGVIDRVSFARLSKEYFDNKNEYYSSCKTLYMYISAISFLVVSVMSCLSNDIVLILLGPAWGDAALILSVIGYASAGLGIESAARIVLKSSGKSVEILKTEIIKKSISVALVFASVPFGLSGFLNAIVLASIISALISLYFVSRYSELTYQKQLMLILPGLFSSIFVMRVYTDSLVQLDGLYLKFILDLMLILALYSSAIAILFILYWLLFRNHCDN